MSYLGWKVRWWCWIQKKVSYFFLNYRFKTFFDQRAAEYQMKMNAMHRDRDEAQYDHIYYPDQVKHYGVDLSAAAEPAEEPAADAEE